MTAAEISRRWPFVYHVTFARNLPSIRKTRAIRPAAELARAAGLGQASGLRRDERTLRVDGVEVCLRNQRALDPAALRLAEGEHLEDFLAYLDGRTYFWPGDVLGPVADGQRMIATHGAGRPAAVIRAPMRALIDTNLPRALCVATVNTGAAWHGSGHGARQLRSAVVPLSGFRGDVRAIVECSFDGAARLPPGAQVAAAGLRDWQGLW